MKHLKRILTLTLALVLLVTGMDFTFVLPEAKAEGGPSYGTTSVPSIPTEVLYSGEWIYWIEHDVAYVAGYNNIKENKLVVPGKLGGVPVVGIAHNAFASNSALKYIKLHLNITQIASDAFGSLKGVTIEGSHGSYALAYAYSNGFSAKETTTEATFAVNVIDLSGLSTNAYSSLSDNHATFIKNEATFLKQGQVLFFPKQAGFPTGLGAKITSITDKGSSVEVYFTQPEIQELLSEISGEDYIYIDWANAEWAEGYEPAVQPSGLLSGEKRGDVYKTNEPIYVSTKIGEYTVKGSVDILIDRPYFSWSIGFGWSGPYFKNLEANIPIIAKPSLSITTSQESSKRLGSRKNFIKNVCPKVPILSVAGIINGYMTVDFEYQFEGELSLSCTIKAVYSCHYQNGKGSVSKTKDITNPTLKACAELKFGPKITLYLVIGIEYGGITASIRFLEGSMGLYAKLKGSATMKGVTGNEKLVTCIDGTIQLELSGSIKIGVVKFLSHDTKKLHATIPLGPWTFDILHGHWENNKKVDKCSMKDVDVIFQYKDNKSSKLEKKYNVNDYIKEPALMAAWKPGIKFDGWYVNTGESGLSGKDYKFNFIKQVMPYLGTGHKLYLYAKWTPIGTSGNNPTTVSPTTPTVTPDGGTTTPPPTITPTPTAVPVHVTKITLDKHSIEIYNDDPSALTTLVPVVFPANADDPSITWECDNTSVAFINDNGEFGVGERGTAVITCRSVSDPDIYDTCTVTVKQHVQQVYVETDNDSLLPGETAQMTADCFPENANEKSVTWSSSDSNIATVDQTGKVTAVGYGDAVITATTNDGSNLKDSLTVHVEHELALEVSMINDTAIMQSNEDILIGYVMPTTGSMRRMAQGNHALQWSIARKSGTATSVIEEIDTTYSENEESYESSFVSLIGTDFPSAGSSVFTVTCNAGPYTASVDVTLNVDGTAYADKVKLNPSTFYLDINEATVIPSQPISADSKPVPHDMQMELTGDNYYNSHATESSVTNGTEISFNESGVFTATVQYWKANIAYEVPVTFYVQDAEGIIHIRVEDIELDQAFVQLVQGEKCQLTATVTPNDAYNKEVSWSSSDSTIASVTSNGLITANKPGTVAIYCEAKDNSGVAAMCAVTVEAYLQLDEDVVEYTLYRNADDHSDLGIINLTYDSQQRLSEDNLNVTWKLTRNSGNSAEIALEEFRNAAEDGVSVSGNIIKLIRINAPGDDTYTLTCSAGAYSDSCIIRIHVLDETLPDFVALSKSSYEGKVNEIISIDLKPVCSPTGTHLPENTVVTVEGNRVFLDAMSSQYSFTEPGELVFAKAGTYHANVVFAGDNYAYSCPITITVKSEDGIVPKNISDIVVSPERVTMLIGESINLSAEVLPADASYSKLTWSSSDTSIVSVSSTGVMTAIGSGTTTVLVTAPETDIVGGCLVTVEDGLTLETEELERTVFVDGTTRMQLDTIMLTESSSIRQTTAPEWTLTRESGNNLTLRAEPYQTTSSSGQTLYGCKIILYSVSRVGDTVYELVCSNGTETASVMITVHAVQRDSVLPSGIELLESTFTANINELIIINPTYVCYPADTTVPNGMKVSMEGDRQFTAALNSQDFFVSQNLSTLSFNIAGTYHATYMMEYANAQYVIPLLFRIKDSGGNVPVQASEVKLNYQNLNMVIKETVQLEAVFSPADTTNQNVTWKSSDTSVATVTPAGKVTAIANGMATITCTPADTEVAPVTCAVTVEDYLTVIPGNTSMVLYMQGEPENVIAEAMLSVGTIERLTKAGIVPIWNVNTTTISHAELETEISSDNTSVAVSSASLLSAGTDTYTITCTAGSNTWQQEYTLIVRDVDGTAPTAITMKKSTVTATVNQPITIDFTPVLTPSNAQLPSNMRSTYVGLGDFYEARDYDSYVAEGDTVNVTFTKAGQYILTRRYRLGNMQFVVPCVIRVGGASSGYNLLTATETEFTVYEGGKSGSVSTVSLNDHMVETLWGDSIHWNIQRVSGNSMNVALKRNGSSVEVFVVDAEKKGTDVWRVSAEFGGLTDFVDITLYSAEPRGPLPQSLILADDTITGVVGTWINVPLSAACLPTGTMLPDQGDEFWSVAMDAHGTDRCIFRIENGLARFSFVESGYYTATFKYQSGNVSYSIPVFFEIRDEEDVIGKPALQIFLVNANATVYPEGEVNVAIARVIIAETLSTSNIGASLAYMNNHDATWSVSINSGTAATLSLIRSNANTYDLILTNIKRSGNITYTISCNVDGSTYSKQANLHVAANTEERPDPTLLHTSYQVVEGEQVVIDRKLYSKKDGSILQSSSSWNPSTFLAAAGYEIQEEEDNWLVTFYKTGTYSTTVESYASNLKIQVPLSIQVIPAGTTVTLSVLKLPAALTEIEEEAFRGVTTNVIDMRGTKVTTIGPAAFMDCVDLMEVYLPGSVRNISDNAFYGCLNVVFHCPNGSYAETYALSHGFNVEN